MARLQATDHEDKRASILVAAAGLFAEYGVRGTSMSMIAMAASGSKAWIYHYFSSKEMIVEDLITTYLKELVAKVNTALAVPGSAGEQLRGLLVGTVLTCNSTRCGPELFEGLEDLSAPVLREINALREEFLGLLEQAIVAVAPRLEILPGQRIAVVQSTLGMLNWQNRRWNGLGPLSGQQWGHAITDMVIGGAVMVSGEDGDARRSSKRRA